MKNILLQYLYIYNRKVIANTFNRYDSFEKYFL